MLEEFKKFALRGNVMDLAIGVIIGAAFGKIVTSLVDDIIMPPLGLLLGKVDFSNLFVSLSGQSYSSLADAKAAGAPTLNYGLFLNSVVNFLLIAVVIFFLVKWLNKIYGEPEKPKQHEPCPYCLTSIPLKATRCPACTSEIKK